MEAFLNYKRYERGAINLMYELYFDYTCKFFHGRAVGKNPIVNYMVEEGVKKPEKCPYPS